MNDFTKEELQQLVKWATTDIDLNPSALEVTLFDKIQSMIDNYCEHEDVGECGICGVTICCNCEKMIPENHCHH